MNKHTANGVAVYTDVHKTYSNTQGVKHETVKHSVGEYVNDQATTNGEKSFRALVKCGYNGVYHH